MQKASGRGLTLFIRFWKYLTSLTCDFPNRFTLIKPVLPVRGVGTGSDFHLNGPSFLAKASNMVHQRLTNLPGAIFRSHIHLLNFGSQCRMMK